MSLAKKCDRCKEFYEKNTILNDILLRQVNKEDEIKRIEIQSAHCNGKTYDLCDDCLMKLTNFLSNKKYYSIPI